jgi:ubiquitin C-terminal hydrolase
MKGRLVTAFRSLLKDVWSGTHRVLSPGELKNIVGEFATQFSGWGQQDSHELITFMLDGIHEDLNRCKVKPLVDIETGDGTNDLEIAQIAWENHKKRNDSIIVDHFHGQLKSRLYCPECEKTTVVFDPFMTLSLPISQPRVKNVAIVFVPHEYTQPWAGLKITVPSEANAEDYSRAISQKLGRDAKVILASYSKYFNKFQWGIAESLSYSKTIYFAFEVNDANKVYAKCWIKMNLNSKYYQNYSTLEKVGTPFLLPVSKENVIASNELYHIEEDKKNELIENAKKELEEEVERMLKCCWEPEDAPEVTDDVEEIARLITDNESGKVKEGHRFGVEIEPIGAMSYGESTPLIFSSDDSRVISNEISIFIADDQRKDEKGFSLPFLMRHFKAFESSDSAAEDEDASVALKHCFEYFSSEEVLDENNQWFCPNCREFVCAKKKMDLWKVPQCFIIHLKRFSPGQYTTYKDERLVDFPDEIDLDEYIVGPKEGKCTKYRLIGVDEHMGSMNGGHYTAKCVVSPEDSNKGEWYSFNDSSCSETNAAATHTAYAYVLFYQRIDDMCPVISSKDHQEDSDD